MKQFSESVTFTNVSSINFPSRSRDFLKDLFRDIVKKHHSKFVISAGNTLDGRYLEEELKYRIKEEEENIKNLNEDIKGGNKIKFTHNDKIRLEEEFINEITEALNKFLPVLGVNYHIVMSKVYDRPIGISILKKLLRMRNDIRLIDDPEAKIPIGNEDVRVIVPHKKPWHYKFITGLMQRLIDPFIQRTFSPKPRLILTGCTGTGAIIPYYRNIPVLSIPALCKIDKGDAAENMAGCLVVKIAIRSGQSKIVARTYDFRSVIFQERGFATAEKISDEEKKVISVLKKGSVSLNTLTFRINRLDDQEQKIFIPREVDRIINSLCERKIVIFNKESNRYGVNEDIVKQARAELSDLLKDNKIVKHVVISCVHIGALKTLYFTILQHLPRFIFDCDTLIINGDLIQGMAHNYEYNGEVLPITIGFDKQELFAAHVVGKILWKNFENRFKEIQNVQKDIEEILNECLISTIINIGNHDAWATQNKHALPLSLFRERLKSILNANIGKFYHESNIKGDISKIADTLESKIKFVGESCLVEVDGITIGLKHPHQARTVTKSQRIQESISSFLDRKEPLPNNFSLVYVANFHEAAAAHWKVFDKTYFGIMTGAYVKDTQFENNKNKVVDFGPAKVTVSFNKENQIIYTEVEFDSYICEIDKKIVYKDKIENQDVSELCQRLNKIVNLPWR